MGRDHRCPAARPPQRVGWAAREAVPVRLLPHRLFKTASQPSPWRGVDHLRRIQVARARAASCPAAVNSAEPASSLRPSSARRQPTTTCGSPVLTGPVTGRDLSADVWYPDESLAGPDGYLRPEFVWAALDCPGAIGAIGEAPGAPAYLLGRFSARQTGPVKTGEPHVVAGWRLAEDGRKLLAGSALFTATGQLAALARATWIRLK